MTAGSERQNSPLPPQKFGKISILPSPPLLITSTCYEKQETKPHSYTSHSGSFLHIHTSLQETDLKPLT